MNSDVVVGLQNFSMTKIRKGGREDGREEIPAHLTIWKLLLDIKMTLINTEGKYNLIKIFATCNRYRINILTTSSCKSIIKIKILFKMSEW